MEKKKSIVFPKYFLCTQHCSNAGGNLYSNLVHVMAYRENDEIFHDPLRQADEAAVCPEESAREL